MEQSLFKLASFGILIAAIWAPVASAQSFGGAGQSGYFYPSSGRIEVFGPGGGFGMPGGNGFDSEGVGAGGGGAGAPGGTQYRTFYPYETPGGAAGANGTLITPHGGNGQPGQNSQFYNDIHSGGGGGGNGVVLDDAGRLLIAIPVLGGDGGADRDGAATGLGDYSGGGSGGYGLVITGASPSAITVAVAGGRVAGGTGGAGYNGGDGGVGAFFITPGSRLNVLSGTVAGGAGGVGADVAGGKGGVGVLGAGLTVLNRGVITGGDGAAFGTLTNTGQGASAAGLGGAGLSGSDLAITNLGTIAGGLSNAGVAGAARADAIAFTGGANSLTLGDETTTGTLIGGLAVSGTLAVDPGRTTGAVTLDNAVTDGTAGAGALTKVGAGTLILNGVNTFTGGTTAADGTLIGAASSFGTGAIVDDATLVLAQATDAVLANPISGAGTLNKTGPGSLDLTGSSAFTGATSIEGGTLLVDGSVAQSVVTVAAGATLGGFGTVGGLVAQDGSRVAPGLATPFSTLTVAGDVAFQAGSTYQVQINAAGQTDSIVASGRATIAGGTVNVLAGSGTYLPSQTYTLLTATAGRTGTFATLTTTSNLVFLTPSLTYDATQVQLVFLQNGMRFPTMAATANQRAAATGLQGLPSTSPLFAAVLSTSLTGARMAFDATSGEIHASAVAAGIEDSRLSQEAIFERLDSVPASAVGADPFGSLVPVLPRSVQGYAPAPRLVLAPPPAYAVWGTGFGAFGSNRGNGNAATLDRSLGGFILGVDTGVNGTVFDGWRIGVAGGYTNDSLRVADRASSGTFETFFGGVYAGVQYGAIDIKLGALGGGTHTDTSRTIAFPGFLDTARSSDGGTMAQGFGEVGYKVRVAAGSVEPLLQGAVIHLSQDGFREVGNAAALLGIGHDTDVETTTLGIKGEQLLPLGGLPIAARGLIGWRHAFGDADPRALLAFEAGGPSFTVEGAPIDRDAVYGKAGVDYRASSALTLGVSYSGQAGERASENAVQGRMDYRF